MSVIQHLSDDMINKIAAGEVVERPASVVKELVENSIDAGATLVRVTTLGGGLRLIEVTDNGCGMNREDARLAVERHATSKIRIQDDLERIETLGFRGEALPSIASVSRFTLLTRPTGDIGGTEVRISDGNFTCDDAAAPAGTTIRVADLFYNTPARLKFMRSERTEMMQIAEMVERLAIANPQVAFELLQDDRRQLQTSGSGKTSEVLLSIYGRQMARGWLPVHSVQDAFVLEGMIGAPELAKGTRNHEHFIVNGRYVQSRSLQHALEEAYRSQLPQKRYPLAVLFLTLPLADVDVNVHPAKTEVRIQNESRLHQFVLHSLQRVLTSVVAGTSENDERYDAATASRVQDRVGGERGMQTYLPVAESAPTPRFGVHDRASIETEPFRWSPAYETSLARDGTKSDTYQAQGVRDEKATPAEEGEEESIFPPFRVVTQLAGTYILAQCAQGWLIADQHAAHERILYQKMVADLRRGGINSQLLLQPQSLQFTSVEEALILEHLTELEQLGFLLEPFGERTMLLRACPMFLGENSGSEAIREVLDQLIQEGRRPDALQIVEKALITLSCKGAIKANTWLPIGRMEELLQQLGRTAYAATCPHGRPTYWLLDIDQLDRHFLRR